MTLPPVWRLSSCKVDLLPQLNCPQVAGESDERPGAQQRKVGERGVEQLLAETLLAADGRVTVIATGPLTNIAWVLANHPEVAPKIEKVLIMGGALDVPGNVFARDVPESDESAEWNFFWDPQAAKAVSVLAPYV
ncbi:unnamed protein product [Sphacelaria rigidula]